MTARAFLARDLLAGLLACPAAFLVAHQVGEPQVERDRPAGGRVLARWA